MSETISVEQYRALMLAKPHQTKKKGNGNKYKAEMELMIKLLGIEYVKEKKFHPDRRWKFDFAIPSKMIAIEYEGLMSDKSRHTSITGFSKDSEKYNKAQQLGWKVFRYTALTYKNLVTDLRTEINNKTAPAPASGK